MENWKQIRDFEEYEVSDLGRVRNKDKVILKPRRCGTNDKRWQVDLYQRRTQKHHTFIIDRLVLETFEPNPNPFVYKRIIHKDKNLGNNRLDNLEWATVKEYFAYCVPRKSKKYGIDYCDIPKETVAYIQEHYIKGDYTFGAKALGRKFNLDNKLVAKIGEKIIRKDG